MSLRNCNRLRKGNRLALPFGSRPLALILLLALMAGSATAEVANRIVLRVNNRIATLWDFQMSYADHVALLRSARDLDSAERERLLEQAGHDVLSSLFDELLILSRADQLRIRLSDRDLDRIVQQIRDENGYSEEEFRQVLQQQGFTEEKLRQEYRKRELWRGVQRREIYPRLDLDAEALRQVYKENIERFEVPEQLHVREVVVLGGEETLSQEVRDLAIKIQDLLDKGKSLDEVAELYDPQLSDVIDVGWVKPGDLAAELDAVAWSLEVGELSPPIEGRGGLHILEVTEKKAASVRPFEEVEEELRGEEQVRQLAEETEKYLRELESTAFVVCEDPELAAGFCQARHDAGREAGGPRFDDLARDLYEAEAESSPADSNEP